MSRGIEIACWADVIRDGEFKQSAAGNRYGMATVAAASGNTDDQGRPISAYLRLMAFNDLAPVAAGLKKGGRVYLEGSLRVGIWRPETGEPRLDLTVMAFRLEPTRIGKARPRQERPDQDRPSLPEPQQQDGRTFEFNDEIGF
jgi:single-stranded DNA-binding protein